MGTWVFFFFCLGVREQKRLGTAALDIHDDILLLTNVYSYLVKVKKFWKKILLRINQSFSRLDQLFIPSILEEGFHSLSWIATVVFKVIMLVWGNRGNYFENANVCSKRTLKTHVKLSVSFYAFGIFTHKSCS